MIGGARSLCGARAASTPTRWEPDGWLSRVHLCVAAPRARPLRLRLACAQHLPELMFFEWRMCVGRAWCVWWQFGTSSLLSDDGCKPKLSNIARLVEVAVRLRETGHNVIIVSSGAVGTGCARMKLKSRPDSVAKKQAMASIGQLHLMRIYDEFFSTLGHTCSQVRARPLPLACRKGASCLCAVCPLLVSARFHSLWASVYKSPSLPSPPVLVLTGTYTTCATVCRCC
jgi:hypothetical protein